MIFCYDTNDDTERVCGHPCESAFLDNAPAQFFDSRIWESIATVQTFILGIFTSFGIQTPARLRTLEALLPESVARSVANMKQRLLSKAAEGDTNLPSEASSSRRVGYLLAIPFACNFHADPIGCYSCRNLSSKQTCRTLYSVCNVSLVSVHELKL